MEVASIYRDRFVPSPQDEPRHGNPLEQVFVLKPLFELGLAARDNVVKERKNRSRSIHHVDCPQS
jgi:hypothetical protein